MKKWLLPFGSLTAIGIGIVVALAVAGVFDGDGASGGGAAAEADDGGGGDVAGVCVEGVPDCVDTIVDDGETGDGIAGACLEGASECNDIPGVPGDVDPDEPVGSDPITSGDGIDPDECSAVHNIDACGRRAVEAAIADLQERLGGGGTVEAGDFAYQEWSNACLDAAGSDEVCAEVITPGFVVVLSADGNEYEYHTDLNGNVRLAETGP